MAGLCKIVEHAPEQIHPLFARRRQRAAHPRAGDLHPQTRAGPCGLARLGSEKIIAFVFWKI